MRGRAGSIRVFLNILQFSNYLKDIFPNLDFQQPITALDLICSIDSKAFIANFGESLDYFQAILRDLEWIGENKRAGFGKQVLAQRESAAYLKSNFELMKSAALTIGLYGYYNDNRGLTTKLVYSATQTAGVLLISSTVRQLDRPSLLLSMHKSLKRHEDIDFDDYKNMVVRIKRKADRSDRQQLAYTGLILGSIYGYSAYRERRETALRNVFAFLSFNFMVVSAVNFGRLGLGSSSVSVVPKPSGELNPRNLALQISQSIQF